MRKKNFLAKSRLTLLFLAFSSLTYFSAQTGPTDDWDGDGIINQTDLDDDNDGISDINEGLCTSPLISAAWTINGTTASYNFGNGVIARVSKLVGGGNFTSETLNTTNFWTPSIAGSPALGSLYTWESRIIIRFETASGAPVLIEKPVLHFDRLGGNFAGTFGPTGTARAVSSLITIANGLTWTELSGTNDFNTTTTTAKDNGAGNTVATNFVAESGTGADNTHAAGGSLQINQIVSEITLDFPRATTNVGNAGGDGLDIVLSNICPVIDTDGDGLADHFDLDSDGDGCPDATEGSAGFTLSLLVASTINGGNTGTTYTGYAAPVNLNLGNTTDANGIPTVANGGQNVGSSKIINSDSDGDGLGNTCDPIDDRPDTDGDGIKDVNDIDDDNDGVLDATESPSCFYTTAEAEVISTVKTSLANDDGTNIELPFMHDGVTTSVAASNNIISINQAINGATIYTVEYPTPIKLTSITHQGTTFGTGATAMVQGSNDNIAWIDLMTAATAATATAKVFTLNSNPNNYKYYRIIKVAGTTTPAITTYELSGAQDTVGYIQSAHPKPTCNTDTDNDGIVNHLDLDSDGDVCSDSVESGNTPFAANNTTTFNTGVDANNNGLLDQFENGTTGTINYTSTYDQYAIFPNVNACNDTDGDGVADITDIDDDNDGVLDTQEDVCNVQPVVYVYAYPSLNQTGSEVQPLYTLGTSTATPNRDEVDTYFYGVGDGVRRPSNTSLTLIEGSYGMDASINTVNFFQNGQIDFQNRFEASVANTGGYYIIEFVLKIPETANTISLRTDTDFACRHALYVAHNGAASPLPSVSKADVRAVGSGNGSTTSPTITFNGSGGKFVRIALTANDGNANSNVKLQWSINGAAFVNVPFSAASIDPCIDVDSDGDSIPNRLDTDSDNDGCSDAKEAGVIDYIIANGGTYSPGTLDNPSNSSSSEVTVGNNTPTDYGTNGFYTAIESNDTQSAAYNGTYTYANAIDSAITACTLFCYKPAITSGTVLDTHKGITSLGRAGVHNSNWPMVRKGGWIALEAKTKGFVPNRLSTAEINAIPAANLVEGMMVYNITLDCLQINTDGTAAGWKCFNTQACP